MTHQFRRYLFLTLIFLTNHFGVAAADQYDEKALKDTQQLLTDPEQRKKAIEAGGDQARKADAMIHQLTGGDPTKTNEIYALTADLMKLLMERSQGDTTKMRQLAEEFGRNPEAFAKSWPEAQQRRLKEIAEKLNRPPASGPN